MYLTNLVNQLKRRDRPSGHKPLMHRLHARREPAQIHRSTLLSQTCQQDIRQLGDSAVLRLPRPARQVERIQVLELVRQNVEAVQRHRHQRPPDRGNFSLGQYRSRSGRVLGPHNHDHGRAPDRLIQHDPPVVAWPEQRLVINNRHLTPAQRLDKQSDQFLVRTRVTDENPTPRTSLRLGRRHARKATARPPERRDHPIIMTRRQIQRVITVGILRGLHRHRPRLPQSLNLGEFPGATTTVLLRHRRP